uniref:Vesicle transport protein n=1 Tax=Ascaris lumbricoides TaxID=6252 RepID=A0A0M3I2N6_ASCLU
MEMAEQDGSKGRGTRGEKPDRAMSALQDFVNQQKAKGALGPSSFSASFSSFNELRSKLSSSISGSISGLPLLSRSTTVDLDSESLTDSASTSGQLPSSRNRRNGGWFSSVTGDEGACGLSRVQRIVAFFMALFGAFFCFGMAVVMLPLIVIQARKFAALNTLGSVMLILSFGFLWGPMNYVKHMLSQERRYVTAAYLSTVIATLYTSVWVSMFFQHAFSSLFACDNYSCYLNCGLSQLLLRS